MKIYKKDLQFIVHYLFQQKEDSKLYSFLRGLFPFSEPQEASLHDMRQLCLSPSEMSIFEGVSGAEVEGNERFFKAVLHLFCQNKSLKKLETLAHSIKEAHNLPPAFHRLFQEELHFLINVEKYGYKAAHLMQTLELLETMPAFPIKVEIPELVPISQHEVRAHLDARFKAEGLPSLEQMWDRFCAAQGENKGQLTPEAKAVLAEMRKNIAEALDNFSSSELKDFLERNFSVPLMVRSSSNEDSEDSDNAGGNESKCNVSPHYNAILEAMAEVIPSYLSEKSLEQRLLAGDDILQMPTLATFIQRMVGATDEPERFCSGIGYREEALARTKGVSAVHVAPGHGELLVNSEGEADDFYVGEMEHIEAVIRDKACRKAPHEAGGLVLKSNPSSIRRQPSLEDDYVITLHRLMGELQKIQGTAIDIEFVVDKAKERICLVQRRPLIFDTGPLQAEYVETDVEGIQGHLVIGADLKVREIRHPDEVLLAQNIGVYTRYRRMPEDQQKKIKCVLLQEKGLRMSHEANQFRRLNIPVISMIKRDAYQMVERCLKQKQPLWIETSSGRIFRADEVTIKEGMLDSPIPLERSLRDAVLPEQLETACPTRTVRQLLRVLKTSDGSEEKSQALGELASLLLSYFDRTLRQSLSKETETLCHQLAKNIFAEFPAVERGLNHPGGSAERVFPIRFLEGLLYQPLRTEIAGGESVKTLAEDARAEEAILKKYGRPDLDEAVLPFYFQYMKLGACSARKGLDEEWNEFLIAILKDPSANTKLAVVVRDFQAIDLGAYWLNVCFNLALDSAKNDPQKCLELLVNGHAEVAKELQWLKAMEKLISDAEKKMPLFGQPEEFGEACRSSWVKLFNDSCNLIQFIENRKLFTTNPEPALVSNRAFDLLERTIESLDQSIKTLTGTPDGQYPDSALKVKHFNLLLSDLLILLMRLAKPMPLEIVSLIQGRREEWTIGTYLIDRVKWLQEIHSRLRKDLSPKQLETTPGFDVQLLRFPDSETFKNKSRICYQDHPLKTSEEVFTTAHGHLKDLIRAWRNGVSSMGGSFQSSDLDDRLAVLKALLHYWGDIPCPSSGTRKTHLSSYISMKGRRLKQSCVLPGEAHEGEFTTQTDIVTGDSTLYLKMVGDNRYGKAGKFRWRNVIFYALLGGKVLDLAYEEEPYWRRHGDSFGDVTLTWKYNLLKLEKEGKIKEFGLTLKEIFALMMAATMTDIAKEDRRFANRFSFKDNNSVLQIIDNLRVVAGERVDQVVDDLDEDFFRAYPYYNHQFCEHYEGKVPAKALKIAFSTLQKGPFESSPVFVKVLTRGLRHSEESVCAQAYAHIAELLSDRSFIHRHSTSANQLASAILKCPEFSAQAQELILSVIGQELSSDHLTQAMGMFLITLKSNSMGGAQTEEYIERFLRDEKQFLVTPFETFSLTQFSSSRAESARVRLNELLVELPEEQLPKADQERRQFLWQLIRIAIQHPDLISAETSMVFLDQLRKQDTQMGLQSYLCIAPKYFESLHKSYLEKKNVAGLEKLLARVPQQWGCYELLKQIHAIDPIAGIQAFERWVENTENFYKPLGFCEDELLSPPSPFLLAFSQWLLQSPEKIRIKFETRLSRFCGILQKENRFDDILSLAELCFKHGVKNKLLPSMEALCGKCLHEDLFLWRKGMDLLCHYAAEEAVVRVLLLPEISTTSGGSDQLLAKLSAVIDHSERLPDAWSMAIALAEPLVYHGQFELLEELLTTKGDGFTEKLRSHCLSLQSTYQRYSFIQGEKEAKEIERFCNELCETTPFPIGPYLRGCLLLAEKTEDFSSLQNLLARLAFDDPWQMEFLKKIGLTIKERKGEERIPLAKEILSILFAKKVEEKWLHNFASSVESESGSSAFVRYKDQKWHEALRKHLLAIKKLSTN